MLSTRFGAARDATGRGRPPHSDSIREALASGGEATPDGFPGQSTDPAPSPLDLYAVAMPAGLFSGDFYLTRESRDGLWIALGDVAGKGLEAALVSSLAQEVLEPLMSGSHEPPEGLVHEVHHALLSELQSPRRFLSLVVAHLDPGGQLNLTNAGHFPPLLVQGPSRRVEEIPSHGAVVGVFPESHWTNLEYRLALDESLVLYSDGVLEATSPEGEEFGTQRLHRAVERSASATTSQQLANGLLTEVKRHREARAPHDDTSILVVRLPSDSQRPR